jgi:hypothetical protein
VGFRFRRSVRLIPGIRLNLSKGGASVSLGGRGFHYTIGPKGTRATIGVPGTGLLWTEYRASGGNFSQRGTQRKSAASYVSPSPWISPVSQFEPEPRLTPIESKAGDEINALSTSQLAPALDRAHRRFRLAIPTLIGSAVLFVFAVNSGIQELVGICALYLSVCVPISLFLDRHRRSVRVTLELSHPAQTIADVLSESFSELKGCDALWSIRAQAYTADWKRNAGATKLNERDRIWPKLTRPSCIRGSVIVPAIKLGNVELFFLPDSILAISKKSVAALNYRDLDFSHGATTFIEDGRVPRDALVVGQTWRFVNKSGGPDRRFNFNRQLSVCRYGEMDFGSAGGLNGKIHFSNISAGARFQKAIDILIRHAASNLELNPIASYQEAKTWPTTVFLSCAILIGGLLASLSLTLGTPDSPNVLNSQAHPQSDKINGVGVDKRSVINPPSKSAPDRKIPGAPLDISPSLSEPQYPLPPTQSYGPTLTEPSYRAVPSQQFHQPLTGRR